MDREPWTQGEVAVAKELALLLNHTWQRIGPDPMPGPNTLRMARELTHGLNALGLHFAGLCPRCRYAIDSVPCQEAHDG